MDQRKQAISSDLETQWQDHFHMRDQTWKVLQYSILFFLGVVGLEIKGEHKDLLIVAYVALLVTSVFGFLVALHHRRRQNEKFEIIKIYETELGLYELIKPVVDPVVDNDHKRSKGWIKRYTGWIKRYTGWINRFTGWINTSTYIVVMQLALAFVATLLFVRTLLS